MIKIFLLVIHMSVGEFITISELFKLHISLYLLITSRLMTLPSASLTNIISLHL